MVRLERFVLVFVLASLVWACDGGWKDRSERIDVVVEKETKIDFLDSAALHAIDSAGIECEDFSCRSFEVSTSEWRRDTVDRYEPLTIYIETEIDTINYTEDYTVYRWNRWLYLEIYGCQTIECLDAEKIVLHNDDYSYSVLLKKGDFTISKLDKSKMPSAQGEVYVMHYFNLKIEVEGIRINWNVQMAQSEYTEWVPYHFVPLWG